MPVWLENRGVSDPIGGGFRFPVVSHTLTTGKLIMTTTIKEFAAVLKCTPGGVLKRLQVLGLADTCTRCGGCGEYSFNLMYGTKCFGCYGVGYKLPKLTRKLLQYAQEKEQAGGLDEYRQQLKLIVAAKKQGWELLAEYAALTADETKAVESAGGRKFWGVGTVKGFLTRAAAHPAYEAAHKAVTAMGYAKTDAERTSHAAQFMAYREEMFAAVRDLVPANADTQVLDITSAEPDGYREIEAVVREAAQKRVVAIRSLFQ